MATVGNPINWNQVNVNAGDLAVRTRELAHDIDVYFTAFEQLGADDPGRAAALTALAQASGITLATTGGLTGNGQAADLVYLSNVLNTVSAILKGQAIQNPAFNFLTQLAALCGFK